MGFEPGYQVSKALVTITALMISKRSLNWIDIFQARTTNDENEVDENLEFDEKFFDDSKSSCEILRTVFLIQILHLLNFFSITKVSS